MGRNLRQPNNRLNLLVRRGRPVVMFGLTTWTQPKPHGMVLNLATRGGRVCRPVEFAEACFAVCGLLRLLGMLLSMKRARPRYPKKHESFLSSDGYHHTLWKYRNAVSVSRYRHREKKGSASVFDRYRNTEYRRHCGIFHLSCTKASIPVSYTHLTLPTICSV